MAKKQRSGKPVPGGGRVTAKGVRPDGSTGRADGTTLNARPPAPSRLDPTHGAPPRGQAGPTRAGHHRGQR